MFGIPLGLTSIFTPLWVFALKNFSAALRRNVVIHYVRFQNILFSESSSGQRGFIGGDLLGRAAITKAKQAAPNRYTAKPTLLIYVKIVNVLEYSLMFE